MTSRPDVVILAVKMPDVDGAIETAGAWPAVPVLAVGNGVGADEVLRDARSGSILAGSLTTAIELDPATGTVHRRSRGGLGLAIVRAVDGGSAALPANRALDALAASFASGGLRVRRLDDAVAMRWSKLLANLLGNATCAILDLEPAEVYRVPRLFDVERRQLREALAVMRGLHVSPVALPGADVRPLALAARLPAALVRPVMLRMIGGGRGGKSPSLRLHLQAGAGPSEVEWLNGAVARAAVRAGRRAPVNARLAELVEECRRIPSGGPGSGAVRTGWSTSCRAAQGTDPQRIRADRNRPIYCPAMDARTLIVAVTSIVGGYLIGAIPWGVVIARVVGGPDPRTMGSGRTGGANVMRALGPRVAMVAGLLDLGKGCLSVAIPELLGADTAVVALAVLAAIIGHSRSLYIGFRGGRGVSPAFGALLVLWPLVALLIVPVFAGVVWLTRYSSVGSLTAAALTAVVLVAIIVILALPPTHYIYALGGPALIWLFHLDNIQRLLSGSERTIDQRA